MNWRARYLFGAACFIVACKSKPPPAAASSVDAATAPDASAQETIRTDAGAVAPRSGGSRNNVVDYLAVSSRVDNGTETPFALCDDDLDTAWSSKTGDLVGAWVAMRVFDAKARVTAIGLTVGMTKDPDLFVQNVRIAEVKVTFSPIVGNDRYISDKSTFGPETTLVEHAPLDVSVRALQKIPLAFAGRGIVKIVVTKITPGTKPSWREATISELALYDDAGRIGTSPFRFTVGSLDPKPRGVLGIVPEARAPLGCLAMLPNVPRLYCVLGAEGTYLGGPLAADLVTLDKTGLHSIASLERTPSFDSLIPYAGWLKAEHDAKGATTLIKPDGTFTRVAGSVPVPWSQSVDVQGVTFRQRSTNEIHASPDAGGEEEGPSDYFNGVVEVKWPGASTFATLLDETSPAATVAPPAVTVSPVGSMWLVERSWSHGSEGVVVSGGEAVLCDFAAKKCTDWVAPTSPDPER